MDRCTGSSPVTSLVNGRAHHEHHLELADLDLVALVQRDLLDPLAADVGAVERAHIGQVIAAARRRISAWRRETVTSSRKIELSG